MTLAFPLTSAAEGGIRDPARVGGFSFAFARAGEVREAVNTDIVSEFAPSRRRRDESGQEATESRGTPGVCVCVCVCVERASVRARERKRARERERPVRVGSRYVEPP